MSTMSTLATQICNQINSVFSHSTTTSPSPLSTIVHEIHTTAAANSRIFLHGVGREGLMLKGLCMRLFHLGLSAHCVGDMTAPPISSSDLLIASAGPGGFSTVDAICGIARSEGARVLVITAREKGSAAEFASSVVVLPAKTMAEEEREEAAAEVLPMGSVYEGALFVLFEMVVFELMRALGQTPQAVRSRHTNLE